MDKDEKCFFCYSEQANVLKLVLELKETFYTGKKIAVKICSNCIDKENY